MNFLVNIDVSALNTALQFYCEAFGLKVGRRFGEFGVELVGGPAPIYLLVKAGATKATESAQVLRDYDRHWTPVHLDFVVDDIEHAVQKAIAAGAKLEKSVAEHKWGKLALLVDPFGNGFCFVQFIGRGYDEIADK